MTSLSGNCGAGEEKVVRVQIAIPPVIQATAARLTAIASFHPVDRIALMIPVGVTVAGSTFVSC
jgi:hypothetical protein